WLFNYTGDFKKAIGNFDLSATVAARGPNNQTNFFGLGNQPLFVNSGDKKILYYRDRYDLINADLRLYRTYHNLQVSAGFIGQYYSSNAANNTTHFLSEYNQQHPDENVFSTKTYSGL